MRNPSRPSPRFSYCKRQKLWWRPGNEAKRYAHHHSLLYTHTLTHTHTHFLTPTTHTLHHSTRLVHDNFDALASRVHSWTTADAARFLRVATHRGRRRPRNQQDFMNTVIGLSPTILYHAILGSSVRGPTNSYEVTLW